MRHRVNLYRPTIQQGQAGQEIASYTLLYASIPCLIQQADSKEAFYYSEHGLENIYEIITGWTTLGILRNDLLQDLAGVEYHVVGVQYEPVLNSTVTLTCMQYSEGAKKRLDKESYV